MLIRFYFRSGLYAQGPNLVTMVECLFLSFLFWLLCLSSPCGFDEAWRGDTQFDYNLAAFSVSGWLFLVFTRLNVNPLMLPEASQHHN